MKHCFIYILTLAFLCGVVSAQYSVEKHRNGRFEYESVTNDPLGVRKYVLSNGLTVYTSVQKDEPRIQTLIAVRAGSKNDPADATGLAHYLEHMLFKGTDKYGTLNFEKERPLVDQIEELFETYRRTTDSAQRVSIYHRIDSLSGLASTYAIPGEYDRVMKRLGARGTNAHTSVEETVYENNIPRNQLKRWLSLEAERFRNPVLRLFHTELEAVYEEKNRGLDNDGRIAYETLMEAAFPHHQYGTQTTIGTIEHLKNPSMRKIKEYYKKNYVPNNMSIILVGDLDPDEAVAMIDEAFSSFTSAKLEPFVVAKEEAFAKPVVRHVVGPSSESVTLAYRFDGAGSRDVNLLTMCDMILSNSSAGLIDMNLVQKQKVLAATASPVIMTDYSLHRFNAAPRRGQKLEDILQLLLDQIEELKQGNFTEATMKAVINDLEINRLRQMESTSNRASVIAQTFIHHEEWKDIVGFLNSLKSITKQEIVDFAKSHYTNNYVVVYKRSGQNTDVQKVKKPEITPVTVNRDAQSDFAKNILAMPAEKILPRFSDFSKDIQRSTLANGAEVLCVKNTENSLYNLQFVWDYGTMHNREYSIAMQYLDFVGSSSMSAEQIKAKLYELGCSIRVSAGTESMTIELSGTSEHLPEALKIINDRMTSPQADTAAFKELIEGVIKQRANMKKNRSVILNQALVNYVTYGKRNPFTNVLSEKELRELTAEKIIGVIKSMAGLNHKVEYYGPLELKEVSTLIEKNHTMPASLKSLPEPDAFVFQDNTEGGVYFVNFEMVQAEVVMRLKSDVGYSLDVSPLARLYNEYNGGLSGVVFQTIRESKALAYSVEAGFSTPRKQKDPYYFAAYIGTQADKLPEALVAMNDVLMTMPRNDEAFSNAQKSLLEKIESERFTKMALIQQYDNLRRIGQDYDVRSTIYDKIPKLSFEDLFKFKDQRLNAKKFCYLVVGSKGKISMDVLKKYGEIHELSLEEIFGF